jgi:thiol-disulfide isomerase/thioredoxin
MGPRLLPLLRTALALGLLWLSPVRLAADERLALPGLEVGRLTEADLEDGTTILVVWASWSPRCRGVAASIAALAEAWSGKARVASVVFQEEPSAVRRFLAGRDLRSPVYLDTTGAFSKRHAVTTLPGLLVFDGGKAAFRGKLPADPDPVIERALTSDSEEP